MYLKNKNKVEHFSVTNSTYYSYLGEVKKGAMLFFIGLVLLVLEANGSMEMLPANFIYVPIIGFVVLGSVVVAINFDDALRVWQHRWVIDGLHDDLNAWLGTELPGQIRTLSRPGYGILRVEVHEYSWRISFYSMDDLGPPFNPEAPTLRITVARDYLYDLNGRRLLEDTPGNRSHLRSITQILRKGDMKR